jgi:hypothetical protein
MLYSLDEKANPGSPRIISHSVGLAEKVAGAWIGIKIAALLLVLEGQPPERTAGSKIWKLSMTRCKSAFVDPYQRE